MIPLFKPYVPELPYLNELMHSDKLSCGEYVQQFEKAFGQYIGVGLNKTLVTNTFGMAVFVVLSTLKLQPGDEVIMSPMACLVSTQPYAAFGLKVCWADIDPLKGTLDPDSVRQKITPKTKCIVHNHFCGYPGYLDEINEIGKNNGIYVIDDLIEGFGSEYKGKKLGDCGSDITIFSFGPVRIPNTIEGGAIIFKDSSLVERAKLIRDNGINRHIFRDEIGEINENCDILMNGYDATMSNVNAYIGIEQLKDVDTILHKQRENAEYWKQRLIPLHYRMLNSIDSIPNYWVFGILTENKRDTINMFRQDGFYASGVHMLNSRYSVFGKQTSLQGAEEFYKNFVALPCGWWMNNEE